MTIAYSIYFITLSFYMLYLYSYFILCKTLTFCCDYQSLIKSIISQNWVSTLVVELPLSSELGNPLRDLCNLVKVNYIWQDITWYWYAANILVSHVIFSPEESSPQWRAMRTSQCLNSLQIFLATMSGLTEEAR